MKTAIYQAFYMYGIAFVISMGVALLITCLFRFLQFLGRKNTR